MANLRLLVALSLALLLVSRPTVRLVAAQDDDDDADDFGAGEDYGGDSDDMGGMDDADDAEIPDGDDGDVVGLTKETLDEYVNSGKPFLLEFYAPWCGHCKALASEYKSAAKVLKEHGVTLAKMDATKFESVSSDYGVEGYPTILWVDGKKIKAFNGDRTEKGIINWVKKRIGFAVINLASETEAKQALEEHSAMVVGHFADLKGAEAAAYAEAGKEGDDIQFVQTDSPAVAKVLGLSGKAPAVALVKNEDDKFVAYDGPFAGDNITQFVMANKLPLFVTFSDDSASLIFGGSIKKMVFLFFPDAEHAALTASFSDAAREFKGKLIFVYINSTLDDMDNVREFFGVDSTARTALGFSTEKREDGEKFAMEAELNAANLRQFASDFLEGKAAQFFKSEDIPAENSAPVTVVVGKNFKDVVLDPTKDVLLEIYAPWCGHCKALEPTYNKLGEKFKSVSSVVIAKMDGTANEHPDVKVEGFPTILFYPANNKENPISVDAERKLNALANFVKENASVKFELPEGEAEEEEPEPEEEPDYAEEDEEAEEEDSKKDEL